MDTPHLSGSQRAYLFRQDEFLAGIRQRAESLFADGYDVEGSREPHVFRVNCPVSKNGERTSYRVDPVRANCTCPFYTHQGSEPLTDTGDRVPCKHLVGLPGLVHTTCCDLVRKRHLGRYYRLFVQWRKASALRPDLDAQWQALGPVSSRVSDGTPSPQGELSPRKETQPCKKPETCIGTTSPNE